MGLTKLSFSQLLGVQSQNVNILLFAASAPDPTAYVVGDKYFNTTDNKIYTVYDNAGTNAWDAGVVPVYNVVYLNLELFQSYMYNGITLQILGAASGGIDNVLFFAPTTQGSGDGSSWENAMAFNQTNYDAMNSGYTALLLGGTYTLSATFTSTAGKDVIGGFTGLDFLREKPALVKKGSYTDEDTILFNPSATVFVPSGYIQGFIANSTITGLVFKGFMSDVNGIAVKNNGQIVQDCLAISISSLPVYGVNSVFYSEDYDSRFINCTVTYCTGRVHGFGGYGGFIGCRAANIIIPDGVNTLGAGFFMSGYWSFLTDCIAENCKILCTGDGHGAGFDISNTGWLRNCKAINCTTANGVGAGFASAGDVHLYNCEAIGCIAKGAEKRAGGFYGGHLDKCVARDCAAIGTPNVFGGGFAEATLTDCVAINCYAPSQPAAGQLPYQPLGGVTEINCYSKRTTNEDLVATTPSLYYCYPCNDYIYGTLDSLTVQNIENSQYEATFSFTTSASWTGLTLPAGTKYIGLDPSTLSASKTYRMIVKNSVVEIKEIS